MKTKILSFVLSAIFATAFVFNVSENSVIRNPEAKAVDLQAEKTVEDGDWSYIIGTDSVDIYKYLGKSSSVIVPDSYNDLPVTSIRAFAFNRNLRIKEVAIPDSITSIGEFAFNSCEQLQSITLSNNLEEIESNAFSGCENLENIIIPKSVDIVGKMAFSNCKKLKRIAFENPEVFISSEALNKFQGIIYGYVGSTALDYAQSNRMRFKEIDYYYSDISDTTSEFEYYDSNSIYTGTDRTRPTYPTATTATIATTEDLSTTKQDIITTEGLITTSKNINSSIVSNTIPTTDIVLTTTSITTTNDTDIITTVSMTTKDLTIHDVNGDRFTTMADAILISRYISEDVTLSSEWKKAITSEKFDLDEDGYITVIDLCMMLEFIAGIN